MKSFAMNHVVAVCQTSQNIDVLADEMKRFCKEYHCTMECTHNDALFVADRDNIVLIDNYKKSRGHLNEA